jgi:hypothetical protein
MNQRRTLVLRPPRAITLKRKKTILVVSRVVAVKNPEDAEYVAISPGSDHSPGYDIGVSTTLAASLPTRIFIQEGSKAVTRCYYEQIAPMQDPTETMTSEFSVYPFLMTEDFEPYWYHSI